MGWIRNNMVLVTMVPFIISFHYGWMYLQSMDELNTGHHKPLTEQPIITATRKFYHLLVDDKDAGAQDKNDAEK